jgi:hypothetical protein
MKQNSSLSPPEGSGVLPGPGDNAGDAEPVGDRVGGYDPHGYEEIVYGSDTESGRRTFVFKPRLVEKGN